MRRFAALFAVTTVTVAACNADIGEPTGIVIIQDAGAEAEAEAAAPPGTNKALGADCTGPEECASGLCFVGGQASYCSLHCTTDNGSTVCTTLPFDGTCNKQGYCRRP